jgi:hypothetical protein
VGHDAHFEATLLIFVQQTVCCLSVGAREIPQDRRTSIKRPIDHTAIMVRLMSASADQLR